MDENINEQPTTITPNNGPNGQILAQRVQNAPTLALKAEQLWMLPAAERHAALGSLPYDVVAAIIESNVEENTALMGNLPAAKFNEIANNAPPVVGREWLERAVTSGQIGAMMLPALMNPRDLTSMIMSAPEMRAVMPKLLNFRRADQMRSLLHPLEWKTSIDDLLLADADDLLLKAPIKNRGIRAILQSLLDFFPELYLETVRLCLESAKYQEDHREEMHDITDEAFAIPDFLRAENIPDAPGEAVAGSAPAASQFGSTNGASPATDNPALNEIVPAAADPFLALATSKLSEERRTELETELKNLLRQEIVATGSFAQADLMRSAGRLLFQLRAGLEKSGGATPESAAKVLETKNLTDVSLVGARVAERIRQRGLALAGLKDWLDRYQKQFLASLSKLETGLDPKTGEPVIWLATKLNQPREEWAAYTSTDIDNQLEEIAVWAGLARAAFATPARVQSIFATAKTKSAEEAARRTVIALCLYRRWEPELVRPGEDYAPFRREFGDSLRRLNAARETVLAALDATPDESWKPADAKQKARGYLLRAIDQLEAQKLDG